MRVCVPLFVAIGDAAAGQVVRGKLHDNPVTGENTDVIHSDLARNVAQNRMTVLELDLNMALGSGSFTVPSSSIASSFFTSNHLSLENDSD